jgi:hypothetical protein
MIYEREAPIDMPPERLARLCGCTVTNFRKALATLLAEGKLIETDAGLWNKRAECELEKRTALRTNAKRSAEARWRKTKEKQCKSDATASNPHMRNTCLPEPEPEPDIRNRDTNVSLALIAPEQPPDRFSEFWQQYPHRNGAKKGKAVAVKAWAKALRSGATADSIIAGAMRYATDKQVIEGYAKDPATWLNQQGWQDDIEQSSTSKPREGRSGNGMVAAFAAVAARRSTGPGAG